MGKPSFPALSRLVESEHTDESAGERGIFAAAFFVLDHRGVELRPNRPACAGWRGPEELLVGTGDLDPEPKGNVRDRHIFAGTEERPIRPIARA